MSSPRERLPQRAAPRDHRRPLDRQCRCLCRSSQRPGLPRISISRSTRSEAEGSATLSGAIGIQALGRFTIHRRNAHNRVHLGRRELGALSFGIGAYLEALGRRQNSFFRAKLLLLTLVPKRSRRSRRELRPLGVAVGDEAPAAPFDVDLFIILPGATTLPPREAPVGQRPEFGSSPDEFRRTPGKAVAIAAIINEGCLERQLYPSDLGEIDIPAQRSLAR